MNTPPILQHIRKHRTFVSDYQGDLGVNLLYNLLKQESVCFDTETTGLDALHANLSVFHFIRKGKRILCSFPENQKKLKF
jgi:DNA polymerase-1